MIIIKSIVVLDDEYKTRIVTDYSASAIEQCFKNDGYCVLDTQDCQEQYMVTPKSVLLVATYFEKE